MIALAKIRECGFRLRLDGDDFIVAPFDKLTAQQIAYLRGHKPEIVQALREERAGTRSINGPAAILNQARAAQKPAILALLTESHELSGISPEFAARLSPDDLADIASGEVPIPTVQAYEQAAVAREAEDLREHFEERAGILEYDAGLSRPEAQIEAARMTAILARNRGYLWAALRAAFASCPELLSQLPDKPGPVDNLPLGTSRLAVLNGRRTVRQGTFTGPHEAKA